MGLIDHKIENTDITTYGVVAAPDRLTGTAEENKKVFDRLIRDSVKGDFNSLIDLLVASTAASELGFESTDEITAENIQEAIEALYSSGQAGVAKAIEEALKSEGYAVGKQDGTDVTEGEYYHNNAKYYKEQANDSAISAETAQRKAEEAVGHYPEIRFVSSPTPGYYWFVWDAENEAYVNTNVRADGGGNAIWGTITGNIANQPDLVAALGTKYEKPAGGIPATDISGIPYVTTTPTVANTDGLKIAILTTIPAPASQLDGWLYLKKG